MTSEKLKERGNDAFKANNFEEAIDLYSQAIAIDDLNHLLYANRAAGYLALKKYEDARTDSLKCIALDKTFLKAYLRLAHAERGLGNNEAALKALKDGESMFPSGNAKKGKKTGLNDFKKLEKEIKHEIAPKRGPTGADVQQAMMGGGGARANPQETQALGERIVQAKWKYSKLNRHLASKEKEVQEKKLILSSLSQEFQSDADTVPMYRTMGKAFLLQPANELFSSVQKEAEDAEKEVQNLSKGQGLLLRNLQDAERALVEHFRRQN